MTWSGIDFNSFFGGLSKPSGYTIIVLNQCINDKGDFHRLYRGASARICADGGWDRLVSWIEKKHFMIEDFIPDYIIGDMDSTEVDIDAVKLPKIVKVDDQDTNDLQKCINYISSFTEPGHFILVFGGLGGRLDQELASLNVMHQFQQYRIIFFNERSVMTSLGPGSHRLKLPDSYFRREAKCGFMPLAGPSVVTTSGFRWNLQGQGKHGVLAAKISMALEMRIGGLISSSNIAVDYEAKIETSAPLVFTLELWQSMDF